MTTLNERELVTLVQASLPYDTRLFQQLITPYLPVLKGYCVKLLKHQPDAEDVVQEIIIKVLAHLKNFKWAVSFKAWLFKIAHNECINKIRDRRWDTIEHNDEYLESITNDDNSHEDFGTALSLLMVNLSFADRNIMLLRYRTGLEFQEIADICHLNISAVKMRHKRVVDFLQQRLKQ
ncbi:MULTISPECIES: RNA polymerase sigma factor SigX [unclassified Colwellia]|uniref:RNA polymerase sigma factor SigX n=1 Tax=unclassified Colwellia TaxID=196834 RepID=UPI0015F480CC|nr:MULTISPECIES: RNA polymerase sigma factor SigX [unclassified Colwellia]MBA6346948.1 RNA polymerase sigma factor SigX [Colwellia sp. BRX8-9]MBA6355320.1 RNA polymerase sigma factor SigX [Colwellia sp. BRX8-3]MBA6361235.1 RNA polymerase sigma factor SigX [Colwellia sp. BRX8-6]MBA6367359.1 RNA polymerase sigma factor SigX [Colwellia sp. BRX8-5]MBA6375508.1 RNA polymerase sigma factor SigX [Colwellia sp. BRX8-2]